MARYEYACGFVEDGWARAIAGIEAELARNPRFGEELLNEADEGEPPSQPGMWGTIRAWLKPRAVRRTIYDKLAPPDALY